MAGCECGPAGWMKQGQAATVDGDSGQLEEARFYLG